MKSRLGFVGIIVENREISAAEVNMILSEHGNIIIARMGLPYDKEECSIINLIVKSTTDQLGSLAGKLGSIKGVSVKSALSKDS